MLAVGTATLTTATTLLVQGSHAEGGLLGLLGVGLIVGYDVLDDRVKGEPRLPEGIDAETIEWLAEEGAELIRGKRSDESGSQ